MNGFSDIIGHEQIIEHFQNSLRNKQLSHAYILNGEKGSGRNTLSNAFAKAIVCEAGYGNACGMCRSCMQFDSGNHPDVKRLLREKPASIGVDEIREQINNDIVIKPYNGRYKVYIIPDAHLMTPQAQNALLKTIEEPPSYAVIMLLTDTLDALLPTIRSRCIVLNLKNVDEKQIVKLLMEKYEIPDYRAGICAAYSQGNTGKAIRMAVSEDFQEMHSLMLRTLKKVDEMRVADMASAIYDISAYKNQITDFLDLMLVWYRDVLIIKATNDLNSIVYKDEYRSLFKKAEKSSYEGLSNIFSAIETARERLRVNANFEWTMELLLVNIKEN